MIYVLMGKSAVGKDTVIQELLNNKEIGLKKIVQYTTRPIKELEKDGREYFFVDVDTMNRLEAEDKIIEKRLYKTVYGDWYYFTKKENLDIKNESYILIGTPDALKKLKSHYGEQNVKGILLILEDGIRLQRALNRERKVKTPRYAEMCRRFLSDEEDFSEKNLGEVEFTVENMDLSDTLNNIIDFIKKE